MHSRFLFCFPRFAVNIATYRSIYQCPRFKFAWSKTLKCSSIQSKLKVTFLFQFLLCLLFSFTSTQPSSEYKLKHCCRLLRKRCDLVKNNLFELRGEVISRRLRLYGHYCQWCWCCLYEIVSLKRYSMKKLWSKSNRLATCA